MGKRNRLRKRFMPWLIVLITLYSMYCGLLFFFQTKLIFPAAMAGQPGQTLPTVETEAIQWPTEEGTTTAWLIPAPIRFPPTSTNETKTPKPLVVFFHGNAELIDHQHAIIELYHRLDMHVLMVEYRGYGHSDGTPSEHHIVTDTVAIVKDICDRANIAPHKLVLHGRSIGGGLATQVARQTQPTALIVESTFTSLSNMAMRYGVPPFILTSPLQSEQAFQKLSLPILIMHGNLDTIIPISHAHQLHHAATHSELVIFDTDHNAWPPPKEAWLYENSIKAHLTRCGILP